MRKEARCQDVQNKWKCFVECVYWKCLGWTRWNDFRNFYTPGILWQSIRYLSLWCGCSGFWGRFLSEENGWSGRSGLWRSRNWYDKYISKIAFSGISFSSSLFQVCISIMLILPCKSGLVRIVSSTLCGRDAITMRNPFRMASLNCCAINICMSWDA